jgi:hypothetical protein
MIADDSPPNAPLHPLELAYMNPPFSPVSQMVVDLNDTNHTNSLEYP